MNNLPKLEAWQIQPDADTPGLYIQCADAAQRQAIIKTLSNDNPDEPKGCPTPGACSALADIAWYRMCLDVIRMELERGKPLSALQMVLNVLDGSDGPPR